ncbi:ERCC4 domain-containing protein [Mycena kentingensis (nom. inval.)]|nr:ERCC4 domain-containing protein [Mycena kentingensis (nom. inval.)]
MPRPAGPNAKWVQYLDILKAKHENDAEPRHRFKTLCRAQTSLKKEERAYTTAQQLRDVKFIGAVIIKDLERLDANGGDENDPPAPPKRGRPPKRSATEPDLAPRPAKQPRRTASAVQLQPQPELPDAAGFKFSYMSPEGERVRRREEAATIFTMSQALLFKVVYAVTELGHAVEQRLQTRLQKDDDEDYMTGYMLEDEAERYPYSTGFHPAPPAPPAARTVPAPVPQPVPAAAKAPSQQSSKVLSALLAAEGSALRARNTLDPSRQLPRFPQANSVASGSGSQAPVARPSVASQTRPLARAATTAVAGPSSYPTPPALQRTASAPAPLPPTNRPRLSHPIPALPAVEHSSIYAHQLTFPEFTPRVLRAGTYRVKMLLDHREKVGINRHQLRDKLVSKGIRFVDLAALELGDIAWVAEDIRTGEHFVLDVILERKRLDDLVGSIKDGRFHEQKHRLGQSGISRVFYLVEAYNAAQNREIWGPQINTGLSSTQVVDGLLVKETKDHNDTLAYFVGLTEEITRMHQNKDLYVIPSSQIKRHSYLDLQLYLRKRHPTRTYITSFADFQDLNGKSKHLTVRDTWARMLLRVKGLSAEKVGAIVERWQTPRELYEAFLDAERVEVEARRQEAERGVNGGGRGKKKSTVPEARMMLKGIGGSEGGVRAIGAVLAGRVYDLFMKGDLSQIQVQEEEEDE